MPLKDDNHKVARVIKDMEQRISDLEEESRSDTTPNRIRSAEERIGVSEQVVSMRLRQIEPARWSEGSGWRTNSWGSYARS